MLTAKIKKAKEQNLYPDSPPMFVISMKGIT